MGSRVRTYCAQSHIISALGASVEENYKHITQYKTQISRFKDNTPINLIDKSALDTNDIESLTYAEQLSVIALSDVINRSKVALDQARTCLIISTTKGNIDSLNEDIEKTYLWAMSDVIAQYFHCHHQPIIVSNACISGLAAIITATRLIESGQYDNIYVLGIDVVSEFIVSGFNSFKSLSPTICKPYDKSRDGLTLGEGCGVLLLTNQQDKSDSKIIVSGGSISDDANHISGPSRTGDGLFFAIKAAMDQAGTKSSDLGFVNLHGTGTPYNDEMESKALHMAALDSVPCNSLKPYLGHTLGASGVIETILAMEQLQHNSIFGTLGYENNGVPFQLNVSAQHRKITMSHCLKTVSGFGGTNAAIVLSKETEIKSTLPPQVRKSIVESAHIQIEKRSDLLFADYIRDEYKHLGESNMKFFKMDNLAKLAYVSSCKLLKDIQLPYPENRIGIVMCNRSSSLDTDIKHQNMVNQHLPEGASPAIFVYTLANVAPAEIAIKHKFKGELSVFISENKDLDFISNYARQLLNSNVLDAVVYGWCDYLNEEYNSELILLKTE